MAQGPKAPSYVSNLPIYVPGKPVEEVQRERGIRGEIVKLASNENPLGVSPKAQEAIRLAIPRLNRYPDGGGHYLRCAVAERHGVPQDWIILGNGSTEVIEMLARAYLADGDEAVHSQQSFVMYPIAIGAVNGVCVAVPARPDRGHDLPAIAAAVTPRTKIIYLANPSNPTGTYFTRTEMDEFFNRIPASVLVAVDQAYHEYVARSDYPDALDDLRMGRNVIVLRTFSKIYGLAGIRLGYGLAQPEVVGLLNRVRSPFNTSNLAQAAGLAALEDEEWVDACRRENERELRFMEAELRKRRIRHTPSVTNFVLAQFDRDVKKLFLELQNLGIIIRPVSGPGLENCARISVGTRSENERFFAALDTLTPGS